MKKMWKKGLSLVLAAIMVVGLLPTTAFAAVDSTGRPKDVNNKLVLSIYTGNGFPGEPAVYGTSNYKNINSKFTVQSGATFASTANNQLDWKKIDKDIVQGASSGSTSVWGVYDANGTKDYFLNDASIIQPENEAKMIRAIKTDMKNMSDAEILQRYEIVWYVIKLQHNSGWFGATEWHIDGVIKEKEKISINYYGNGNTSGAAPLGTASHTAGDTYTVLDKNTMVKKINGVEVAFLGWSAKADGTGEEEGFYQPGAVINPTKSISLYAMWDTTTQYTATVNTYLDGKLTSDKDIHGTTRDLHLSTDNVHFYALSEENTGVYTAKITGNGKFHLYNKNADGTYTQIGSYQLTIYNQNGSLDVHHYSVTYDANGGEFEAAHGMQTYNYGNAVIAIDTIPTKTGYCFLGWKKNEGNLILPCEEVTPFIDEAITLTAQWEKTVNVTINVTINHESGDGYDKVETKDDVILALASRENEKSPYLEVEGKTLSLSETSHNGFVYSESEKTTTYTGYTYTDMPGGEVDYTVVTSKSGYDTTVEATQDDNGNWVINVVMTYNPTNFDLEFTVEVDESVPSQYLPDAAIVKVTFWASDRNCWEIITQQEGGKPGVRVDIDSNTRSGSSSYPVWKCESAGSTPYGYRIEITSFVYPDGTIVPASNVVTQDVAWTDNVYTATVSDVIDGQKYGTLNGAYFGNDTQQGKLNAVIDMQLYNVTFYAQGGTVNGENSQTVTQQYKIPGFKNYVPTREGGYTFGGWYEDDRCTVPATEGKDLSADITLYAKWIEPLTISGTVTISGTYEQDGVTVPVHDIDRAKEAEVVLQELRNGMSFDVDSHTVFFGSYDDNGSAEYSFTGIPNDGKTYQIHVLELNYGTTYDNESDTDISYSANEYIAVLGGDDVADVDAYLEFVPPSYNQILEVDATQINDGFRPQNVLSEVVYRDTGDNHAFQRISQHGVPPYGVQIGLNAGLGSGTESIWKWHTDGTLYDYQMNITKVDDVEFDSDTAPFYIEYAVPSRWNGNTNLPSGVLKATLIPNQYLVTFNLNADGDTVIEMDSYLNDETGNYQTIHTWSFDTAINAKPERVGYTFLGWETDVADTYDGNKIDADTHQDVVLTAKWENKTYTVTTVSVPAEGGAISGAGTYEYGSEVTIEATPATGYSFLGWYENDELVSNEMSYSFEILDDHDFVAKFGLNQHTVTTKAEPSEAGTTSGDGVYDHGTEITVTATVNDGYTFTGWYNGNEKVSDELSFNVTVTDNLSYTSKFEIDQYNVTTEAAPAEGGTTSGDGEYALGANVTVIASPGENYQLEGWYENGEKVSENAEYTFVVTGDHTLTAKFTKKALKSYKITATANPEDGGTVSGGGTYEEGTEIVLSAEANEGYTFVGWFAENGERITTDNEFTHIVKESKLFKARYNKISSYKNGYAYIYGYSNTEMGAEGPLLRSEAAVMVHRLVKQNNGRGNFVYDPANPSFTDIAGEWFQCGIEFIHYKGGISAAEGTSVNPYAQITRGEVFKIVALGLGFTDDKTLTYDGYGEILAGDGYIIGSGGSGNLDSGSYMTRAEFCTMYNRIIGRTNALLVDADGNQITAETYGFKDLSPSAWYYEDVLRATSAYENGFVDINKRQERNVIDDYS